MKKLIITGEIKVNTGLHIGGGESFAAIGAVNNVVVKDPITMLPIIPGSSLKGKIRSLLAKERGSFDFSKDGPYIMRLFGGSTRTEKTENNGNAENNSQKAEINTQNEDKNSKNSQFYMSRLQFFDCFISNNQELSNVVTEIKFENTINRQTGAAKPRQVERVVKGSVFKFKLVYNVENEQEIEEDFNILAEGLKLLQLDYLGGNGTRGYGRIAFNNLHVKSVEENEENELLKKLNAILKDTNNYANEKLFD